MLLYLVRHPRPEITPGICYGQSDLELASGYTSDFKIIKSQLPVSNSVIYTSPLKRCLYLAEYLSSSYITAPELMELNFGQWEMQPWNQITRTNLENWANSYFHVPPPDGETFIRLIHRTHCFIKKFNSPETPSIIITHAGVIRVLVGLTESIPPQKWMGIPINYSQVTTIPLNGLSRKFQNISIPEKLSHLP